MVLPPGRKPLTDADMVNLLHSIAGMFQQRNELMEKDLRQIANRLNKLSKGEKNE